MDKHERGWEVQEGRLDMPLPHWNGSTLGDKRRLPKVVQKLLHGRLLTPEEKAELLWRLYELDQRRRARRRWVAGASFAVASLAVLVYLVAYPPVWVRQQLLSLISGSPR